MRARFAAIAVIFSTVLGPAASIAATLKEPAPIPVTPQRHPLQLLGVAVEAVKASKQGWKIDETFGMTEVPGGYRMRVTKEWNDRHVIYAYLTTTPQSVSISYADSRELDFKQGQNGERKILLKTVDSRERGCPCMECVHPALHFGSLGTAVPTPL